MEAGANGQFLGPGPGGRTGARLLPLPTPRRLTRHPPLITKFPALLGPPLLQSQNAQASGGVLGGPLEGQCGQLSTVLGEVVSAAPGLGGFADGGRMGQLKLPGESGERPLVAGTLGQWLVPQVRQEMVPEQVEHLLHVADATGDGDDRLLLGQHHAVLTERSIAAVRPVSAPPELVPVALVPIAGRVAAIGGLAGGRFVNEGGGNQLPTAPFAPLQVELPKGGDVFSPDAQAIAPGRDSLGAEFPGLTADAQGVEQAGLEVVEQGLARGSLEHRRGEVGGGGVVMKVSARLERDGVGEERLDPRTLGRARGFGLLPGVHPQQVAEPHRLEVVGRLGGTLAGKSGEHGIIEAQFSLGDRDAHRRRGETLAEREERVAALGVVGSPPGLGDDLAPANQHQAVQVLDVAVGPVEEFAESDRRDPLRFGRGAGEIRFGPEQGTTQPGAQGQESDAQNARKSLLFHGEPQAGRAEKRTDHRKTARP